MAKQKKYTKSKAEQRPTVAKSVDFISVCRGALMHGFEIALELTSENGNKMRAYLTKDSIYNMAHDLLRLNRRIQQNEANADQKLSIETNYVKDDEDEDVFEDLEFVNAEIHDGALARELAVPKRNRRAKPDYFL